MLPFLLECYPLQQNRQWSFLRMRKEFTQLTTLALPVPKPEKESEEKCGFLIPVSSYPRSFYHFSVFSQQTAFDLLSK